jgi:hypothetical protein
MTAVVPIAPPCFTRGQFLGVPHRSVLYPLISCFVTGPETPASVRTHANSMTANEKR